VDVLAQLLGRSDDAVEQAQLGRPCGGDLLAGGGEAEGLPLADPAGPPRPPGTVTSRVRRNARVTATRVSASPRTTPGAVLVPPRSRPRQNASPTDRTRSTCAPCGGFSSTATSSRRSARVHR